MISVVCPYCNKNVWLEEELLLCFCTYCGNSIVVPDNSEQGTKVGSVEALFDKAMLLLEETDTEKRKVCESEARMLLASGLALEPKNQKVLFALSILNRLPSYAKDYFETAGEIFTDEEEEFLERIMRVDPEFAAGISHLCFEYNAMEKINFLLKKYPYMFTKERLLSRERGKLFKRKNYVEFLLKHGVGIDEVFSVYMKELEPISFDTDEVQFEESKLPLDVFKMYLDFGLDVNTKVNIEENYQVFTIDGYDGIKLIEKTMDLYEFFAVFKKAKEQEGYHKEYKLLYREYFCDFGRKKPDLLRREGLIYYYYEYKINNYTDYMEALKEHGYVPKPKVQAEQPQRKRRFPWF